MSDPCFCVSFLFNFLPCVLVRCRPFPCCPDIASPFPTYTSYNCSPDIHPTQTKHHPNPSSPSAPFPEHQKRSTRALCTLESFSLKKYHLQPFLLLDPFNLKRMPFTIGVDNAAEFNQYLINVVVTTASVAWLLLLFIRSVDKKVIVYRKPFSVAMSLQLLFVTMRNLTTMMLSSGFPIPCRWVAVVGGVIYQFFAISAECAMLIRCRSFTRYPKMLTYLTVPTWIVRLGLCLWLVTTITAPDNVAGYICDTSMDYNLSAIMQYIKIATELVILYFFLERVIALHRSSHGGETDLQWRRLALINSGITFLVILFEVLVGQITIYLTGYLFLTYSLVNLIQATLVVFIVEDTRTVFKKHAEKTSASASKQTSNGQTSGQQPQPYNNQDHDDSVVSYAEGLRSATPIQRQQQPWSLTMRTPSVMPDTIPVQYSPSRPSLNGQSSDFYDVGQITDMRVAKNRHWDVESQNTVEGNPRHWKDTEEDEIPMTLAKSREDALQQHQQHQYHHTRR